jgi:hypothetical protein
LNRANRGDRDLNLSISRIRRVAFHPVRLEERIMIRPEMSRFAPKIDSGVGHVATSAAVTAP